MKTVGIKLTLNRWPYGLEVQPLRDGLLLRSRKARAGWAKSFRQTRPPFDDLAAFSRVTNDFDVREWKW